MPAAPCIHPTWLVSTEGVPCSSGEGKQLAFSAGGPHGRATPNVSRCASERMTTAVGAAPARLVGSCRASAYCETWIRNVLRVWHRQARQHALTCLPRTDVTWVNPSQNKFNNNNDMII
jgi:hypothetical protein